MIVVQALFLLPVISACWSFLTPADGFGLSVFVGSAWISFSLAIISLSLSLSLRGRFLHGFGARGVGARGLGARLYWLAGFLAIF